jgi:hypothetical protein
MKIKNKTSHRKPQGRLSRNCLAIIDMIIDLILFVLTDTDDIGFRLNAKTKVISRTTGLIEPTRYMYHMSWTNTLHVSYVMNQHITCIICHEPTRYLYHMSWINTLHVSYFMNQHVTCIICHEPTRYMYHMSWTKTLHVSYVMENKTVDWLNITKNLNRNFKSYWIKSMGTCLKGNVRKTWLQSVCFYAIIKFHKETNMKMLRSFSQ